MVKQFLKDWNSAIATRKLVKEVRSNKGVILYQDTIFTFMDHNIHIFYSICSNYERMNPKKYVWMEDIVVEETNKSIPSRAVVACSDAKYASLIMNALTAGRDHDDRVHERMNRKKSSMVNEIRSKRLTALKDTSYTDAEKAIIVDAMQPNIDRGLLSWDDMTIDILKEYHNYITGRGLIEVGVDLGAEDSKHVHRMYGLVAELLSAVERNERGSECIHPRTVNYLFLAPRENIIYSIYILRSTMSKIYDVCKSTYKLVHVLKILALLYESITGIKLEDKKNEVMRIKEERKERKLRSAMNTNKTDNKKGKHKKYNNSIRTKPIDGTSASGARLDEAFGDILNTVKVTTTITTEDPVVKVDPTEVVEAEAKSVLTETTADNKQEEDTTVEAPLDLSEPIIVGSLAPEEDEDDYEDYPSDTSDTSNEEDDPDDDLYDDEDEEPHHIKTHKRMKFVDLDD